MDATDLQSAEQQGEIPDLDGIKFFELDAYLIAINLKLDLLIKVLIEGKFSEEEQKRIITSLKNINTIFEK